VVGRYVRLVGTYDCMYVWFVGTYGW